MKYPPQQPPPETEPDNKSSWKNVLAYFLRHRHINANNDEWFHVHRGSSGSGGGGGWIMWILIIGGLVLAYMLFVWLVDVFRTLAPILVLLFMGYIITKVFRK